MAFREHLKSLWRDEAGQTMLEYIVIVSVVVLAGLAVFKVIRDYIESKRSAIDASLSYSQGTGGGGNGGGELPGGGARSPQPPPGGNPQPPLGGWK